MFRKGPIDDPDLAVVYNTAAKWQAEQAKSLLEKEGIPAIIFDREDSGGYLQILGFGSPFGVDVYVNVKNAERAKKLIEEAFSEMEDITDEELEELAMQASLEDEPLN